MNNILIIDDDVDICTLLSRYLTKKGFNTEVAHTGKTGVQMATQKPFDLVLTDFRLGDLDGREVLKKIKEINPNIVVIIITAYIDIKVAIDVVKLGAYDYLTKPLIPDEVLNLVTTALSQKKSKTENTGSITPQTSAGKTDKEEVEIIPTIRSTREDDEYMKSHSAESKAIFKQIEVVAPTNYSVILYGESGTGKEVVAKAIHNLSKRKDMPFVPMDCGTLTKELAGSELFGHEKGAFTGAIASKVGHFELANSGTIFLDEVANLPYDVQVSLLRVIQERKIKRVGGVKEIDVDVRIIIASNENLQDAYKKGRFREDLYFRFNEFSITIPPIRMRKNDIMDFAKFFLDKTNRELGKNIEGFDENVESVFMNYSWPGNLREMRNIVRRAALLTVDGKIKTSALPYEIELYKDKMPSANSYSAEGEHHKEHNIGSELKSAALEAEFETISRVLQQVNYNKSKAAKIMNIDRKTLYNKLRKYKLQDP